MNHCVSVSRQKAQPIATSNRTESKDVRASTLPRRRGDVSPAVSTPQNSPNRQSPRTSTPSVDSAVGSAEGLGVPQAGNHEEIRPRSDGSDSLATSSALTSPEPPVPETNEPRVAIDLVQSDVPPVEILAAEPIFPLVESAPIEETAQKGELSSSSVVKKERERERCVCVRICLVVRKVY